MPAATIEASIKTWIGTGTTASTRISVGSRVQFQTLPAIVIEVTAGEDYALNGGTGLDFRRWEASIRAVAETAIDAESLANTAVQNIILGITAPSIAYEPSKRLIEEPVLGEGDESQPAICTAQIVIFQRV